MGTLEKNDVMVWLNADPLLSAAEAQWYADAARRADEEEKKALERKKFHSQCEPLKELPV